MPGYFTVERDFLESNFWLSEPFTKPQAWVDLFGIANHAPGFFIKRGIHIPIKRSQTGRSELSLALRWTWSRNKVRRFLKWLKLNEMIELKQDNKTSIITICNYNEYQKHLKQDDTPNDTPNDTPERHQKDTKRNTNNNVKNDKKNKNKNKEITYPKEFLKLWTDYPNTKGSKTQTFKNYQTTKKNLSPDQIYSACMNSIKKQDDEKNEMYFQLSNLIGDKYRGDLNDLLNYKSPEDEAIRLINEKRQKKADLLNAKLGPAFGGPHGKANQ